MKNLFEALREGYAGGGHELRLDQFKTLVAGTNSNDVMEVQVEDGMLIVFLKNGTVLEVDRA